MHPFKKNSCFHIIHSRAAFWKGTVGLEKNKSCLFKISFKILTKCLCVLSLLITSTSLPEAYFHLNVFILDSFFFADFPTARFYIKDNEYVESESKVVIVSYSPRKFSVRSFHSVNISSHKKKLTFFFFRNCSCPLLVLTFFFFFLCS